MIAPSCLLLASACVATAYGMRVVSAGLAFVSLCLLAALASVLIRYAMLS